MTIDEMFTPRVTTAESVLGRGALTTAEVALRKYAGDAVPSGSIVGPGGSEKIPGSFEHFVDKARSKLIAATPCPQNNAPNGEPWHSPELKGTFSDHAIVGCGTCDKTWHVPFAMNAENEVEPGVPSERVARYVDPNAPEPVLPPVSDEPDDGDDATPEGANPQA